MTTPTAAQLALLKSNLPIRRVASTPSGGAASFANVLKTATTKKSVSQLPNGVPIFKSAMLSAATPLAPTRPSEVEVFGGPTPISRSDILKNADNLMGVPYVWGGTVNSGLDCSAFVSKAWGVSRHTTDNLSAVAHPIAKDELQAGDALNLTTGADPEGDGHVRLFDKWADVAHTKLWVYEETPPKSIHHVINWDPRYQPMRRTNVLDV